MAGRFGVLALALAAACSSKSDVKTNGGSGATPAPGKPTFTVFALAEVRGQIGPCGCTTDPLGDLSRTAQVIGAQHDVGPTLVVDAGSLLYSKSPVPPHLDAQEDLKADLLAKTYRELGVVVGLGPADLAKGADKLRLPRQASNVTGISTEAPKLVDAGGAKVGVFGVVASDAVTGVQVGDPVAAGKTAVADLRKQGARIVIALVQASSKKDAVRITRDIGGIDLAVAGLGALAPEPEKIDTSAQKVGDAWLVVPANRGQVVPRIDVTVREPGPLVDAIGPGAADAKIESLGKQLAALDDELAKLAQDNSADPAFVKQKTTERAELADQKAKLERQPFAIPAKGSYFTFQQLRINKTLACNDGVQSAVTAFYKAAGEANVKAATAPVPPPDKGKASYAGNAACEDCHDEETKFWQKTVHAQAWKTLVDRGQQFDFDCINCHVTGWNEKGGSNLAHNDKLRDIQCETCHGPASIHVAKGGEEKPFAVQLAPAQDFCFTKCHTKEHSDTFQWEAYMRDIVGPGHGEKARAKLGDGPTGGELRKAALAKAGRMGPGCLR